MAKRPKLFVALLLSCLNSFAQTDTKKAGPLFPVNGMCIDQRTNEGIPFVILKFISSDSAIFSTHTDNDGRFSVRCPRDTYALRTACPGFISRVIQGISVNDTTAMGKVPLRESGYVLNEIEIVSYHEPKIEPDAPQRKKRFFKRRRERY